MKKYLLFRKNRKTEKIDAYTNRIFFTLWDTQFATVLGLNEANTVYGNAIKIMKKDYEFFLVRLGAEKSKTEIIWTGDTKMAEWKRL